MGRLQDGYSMKIRFDSRSQNDPTRIGGMKVPYAPAKRAFARWRWFFVLALAASPLLFFLAKSIFDAIVVDAPAEVSLTQLSINAPAPGIVSTISLKPGDTVEAGASLVKLTDPQLQDRRIAVVNELASIRSIKALQEDGALHLAQRVEQRMARQVGTLRRLMAQGAATLAEVNEAEARHDAALRDLEVARRASGGAGLPADVRAREAFLENEMQNIQMAEQRLTVSAPASGTVLEVFVAQGESKAQGAPLLTLAVEGPGYITAYIAPADMLRVRVGAKAYGQFAEGVSVPLTVFSVAGITQRIPVALHSSFSAPMLVVPVLLKPDMELPKSVLRQGMPCTVYFGVRTPLW